MFLPFIENRKLSLTGMCVCTVLVLYNLVCMRYCGEMDPMDMREGTTWVHSQLGR